VAISFFIILPIIQIIILGLAIDFYPKHMPTAILQYDQSLYTQRFISQLSNSRYFKIKYYVTNESLARELIKSNKVVFVITIPENFTRKMIRGEHPSILVENDATIPGASANAINVIQNLAENLFEREFRGPLNYLNANPAPFNINIHNKYNQNLTTTYNTIPGISGAIITFMIIVASLSIASEKETGTLESLLKTPVSSLEIIVGKFLCFFMILFVQLTGITLLANYILFNIPIYGGLITFLLASVPFLASTVMFGIAISASVKNQMQSQQISGFYIIFSLLLTGFIFPFEAMPSWAKVFGSFLPMTHYIRIASGVMLKDYNWVDIWPEEIPILLFLFVTLLISVIIFRKTLD
jgi:ABC-2 type transport system permease protein